MVPDTLTHETISLYTKDMFPDEMDEVAVQIVIRSPFTGVLSGKGLGVIISPLIEIKEALAGSNNMDEMTTTKI